MLCIHFVWHCSILQRKKEVGAYIGGKRNQGSWFFKDMENKSMRGNESLFKKSQRNGPFRATRQFHEHLGQWNAC